ncbi:hypothetical protein FR762_15590 [Enterobacter sp. E76]|nr:hypothetical protein FR762_15590 [Enterobacter sp. E76]
MHHEFAVESYEKFIENNPESGEYSFIKHWCLEPEMMEFALANCDEKTASIIETIKGMTGYRKPTDKQKSAIALDMLNGRTAKDILRAVYGDKVKDLLPEDAPVEPEEVSDEVVSELAKHDIQLSDKRIAFGALSDFVVDKGEEELGNCYRASVSAVENMRKGASRGTVDALATLVCDERIVVTKDELKKLNQQESDVVTYSSEVMEIERYISIYYNGSHKDFAAALNVTPSKISEWKKLGWVIYDGKIWSSKRTLSRGGRRSEIAVLPDLG